MLWVKYAPELFDTYCVGMVLLQLALPKLRTDYGLRQFRAQLTQVDYDLSRWCARRRRCFAGCFTPLWLARRVMMPDSFT